MKLFLALLLAASPAWAQEGAPEHPEPGVALMHHAAGMSFCVASGGPPSEYEPVFGSTS